MSGADVGTAPVTLLISENLAARMPHLPADHPGVRFVELPVQGGALRAEYLDADAMFRSAMDEALFDEILANTPRLRWIQISAAGFDWMGGDVLAGRIAEGLVVTRSESSLNVTIAEYCIAAMLGVARNLPHYAAAQHRLEWDPVIGSDFNRSTVVIFGTGAIGGEVAWRAAALGARVVGVNRAGTPAQHFAEVVDQRSFMPLLADADHVVLAMPLTPETRHMIGKEQLAALPNHAGLVNVGRGPLVDEDALVAALDAGEVGAAYLDVFAVEPLPPEHPLWTAPNVAITPHASYRSDRTTERLIADFGSNLEAFLAGEPLHGAMKHTDLGY